MEQKYPSKHYTDAEKSRLLKDYVLIDPEFIHLIKFNTHVRYTTYTDGFKPGGFVAKNPVKVNNDEGELLLIKLKNGFVPSAKGYLEWMVPYNNIKEIYTKQDASILTLQKNIHEALKYIMQHNNM